MRSVMVEIASSYRHGRFAEERKRYLCELLDRGWKPNSVRCIAWKLKAFAARVDIYCKGGVTTEQITVAAYAWMREKQSIFRRRIGPHRARLTFINNAKRWLSFLGLLRETKKTNKFTPLVDKFCSFLETEHDSAATTISRRREFVLVFLDWFEQKGRPFNSISVGDVDSFLGAPRPRQWSRRTIGLYVDCLRSFFRFANAKGWCKPIAAAIDGPRIYKAENLPVGPPWDQVKELINNIGVQKRSDIRDRAILLLLASYGFRSKEVRELKLDDLDWRGEKIRLYRSKQRRDQLYPLVRPVGDAILLYLQRVRPQTNRREIFLSLLAPFGPLTRCGLAEIVRSRFERAGMTPRHYGPHGLRHACATHLMAKQFSLKEIGDHLGHTCAESTTIYAKVDLVSLRKVAELDLGEIL